MDLYECRILLVDDEKALLHMVETLLRKEGYRLIDIASNCSSARIFLRQYEYQLILLDVMLPDGDGFLLFEEMKRTCETQAAVMFLSARDEDRSKLTGLGLGADDYITKPFLPEELLLRIKAVLKRTCHIDEKMQTVQIGRAIVDWNAGTIQTPAEDYPLTAKEYALLKKLCENRGRILSMNILCDTLWPDGSYGYENSLMVHVRRLREKLEENPSKPQHLITVRGLGYKLV